MYRSLGLAAKLGLCAALFLIPLGFTAFLLLSGQQREIDFAAKELQGARYLRAIGTVQSEAAAAHINGGGAGARLAQQISSAEAANGAGLDTLRQATAAAAAFAAASTPERIALARTELHKLIEVAREIRTER